jgi:hypothetical protein
MCEGYFPPHSHGGRDGVAPRASPNQAAFPYKHATNLKTIDGAYPLTDDVIVCKLTRLQTESYVMHLGYIVTVQISNGKDVLAKPSTISRISTAIALSKQAHLLA